MFASHAGRLVTTSLIASARGVNEETSYESVLLMSLMMSVGDELSVTSETGNPTNLSKPSMTSVNDGSSGATPTI